MTEREKCRNCQQILVDRYGVELATRVTVIAPGTRQHGHAFCLQCYEADGIYIEAHSINEENKQ